MAHAGNEGVPGAAGTGKGTPAASPSDPDVRLRVVARSAQGLWTMRIENRGSEPVRIPADARLLTLEVRPLVKGEWRPAKVCDGRSAYNLESSFPVERELFLRPGEEYVELFDPRLFCFGPDAPLLTGGSIVKARFGWTPAPKWARGDHEPYAVDGVKYPRIVVPQKQLEAPTILLSFFAPDPPPCDPAPRAPSAAGGRAAPAKGAGANAAGGVVGPVSASPTPPAGAPNVVNGPLLTGPPCPAKAGDGKAPPVGPDASPGASTGARAGQPSDTPGQKPAVTAPGAPAPNAGGPSADPAASPSPAGAQKPGDPAKPTPIVDELAPRLELDATDYADGRAPRDVVISIAAVNRGHRALLTALRNRQLSFDVRGPDGLKRCPQRLDDSSIARDWFQQLAPDGRAALAVLIAEHCPPNTFERPGLYEVDPVLHPDEAARDHGLLAYLKDAKADAPSLVRIRTGRLPYHKTPPQPQPIPDEIRPGVYDDTPPPASAPLQP